MLYFQKGMRAVTLNSEFSLCGLNIYDEYCPHNYCKKGRKEIELLQNLSFQRAFNRAGQLCGECKNGYSLAIGSSNCILCQTNNNLALIIFFVAARFHHQRSRAPCVQAEAKSLRSETITMLLELGAQLSLEKYGFCADHQ